MSQLSGVVSKAMESLNAISGLIPARPFRIADKVFLLTPRPSAASLNPQDMNLPGLYLHELKGKSRGIWSVRVSGNWRVTFKFDGPDAVDVNYEDYH